MLLLALLACADCRAPLAAYCATCPERDAAVADCAAEPESCTVAEPCAGVTVVSWDDGFGGSTSYYTADGALVAVEATSAAEGVCDGTTYGAVPECP